MSDTNETKITAEMIDAGVRALRASDYGNEIRFETDEALVSRLLSSCLGGMERELAEARAVISETVKWVPVEERMPEPDSGPYLCYFKPDEREEAAFGLFGYHHFHGRGRSGALTWTDWVDGDDSSSYGYAEFGVTHWMPLPEAPK